MQGVDDINAALDMYPEYEAIHERTFKNLEEVRASTLALQARDRHGRHVPGHAVG